jgi:neutral ceramidase
MRRNLAGPLLAWMLIAAMALHGVAQTPASAVFRAGAATSNITPPLGELIVGGWAPLPADDVHDELHVRALVLDDGTTKLALALVDNVGIPTEVFQAAYSRVEETIGIPASCQLYAATHTHSATTARGDNAMVHSEVLSDYQEFVANRIADAVRIAHKRLAPARIGWGSVVEPSELFNRRWYVVEEDERRNPFGGVDLVRMNPSSRATLVRPAGPVDPELSFLSVQLADGRPLCVLGNYSLHYVGGVPARTVSADYFAVFANHLEKLLGVQEQSPDFVAMLSNGTSGDVNNINFSNRGPRLEPFEKMTQVGELVAARVAEGLKSVEYRDWVPLHAAARQLALSVRRPNEELRQYMSEVEAQPTDAKPYHAHERTYAERLKVLHASPESVSVPLQVLTIGELGIAAIPFEVFTEIGLDLKENCPFEDSFTIELAGGSFGYLPTPAQHKLGGYETWMGTNKVELDASDKITRALLEMFQDLRE